ncbi:hypothetical protein ILYODFUR_013832, partial [Ilyodon furcidens]
CDWQVLLHRCSSSESNQLGFTWSGHPEGGGRSFFSLGVIDVLPKEAVESFWSPVSLVSCSEEFGNSSLDAPALSLHSASITKSSSQELPRPNH